jgi:hypothetical protein
MSTSIKGKSATARLLVRAAKELERTGARTPQQIRRAVATAVRADIGHLTPRQQQAYVHSVAMGFDDALPVAPRGSTFVNPRKKESSATFRGAAPAGRVSTQTAPDRVRSPKKGPGTVKEPSQKAQDEVFAEAMAARAKLAQEGHFLEPGQFLAASGVSRQAIHQQTRTGALFSVDGPHGVTYYPAFFADPKYDRNAVRRVARAMKDLPGSSKWVFFTSPRLSLGGLSPLEVLGGAKPKRRAGDDAGDSKIDVSAVVRAAAAYAEE